MKSTGACVSPAGSWLVFAAAWIAAQALLPEADAQATKLSRLGFRFDQQAHDAAVAREKSGATLDEEPLHPDVVRLPRYTVTDQRIRLEDREVLTDKGRVDVAMKRYINPAYAKTLGPLSAVASFLNNPLGGWAPNTPEALALYADDERKYRIRREQELTGFIELAEALKRPPPKVPPEKNASKKTRTR